MASKKEIQDQIDKLTADLEGADDGDDFEVEIRDGDKSARVPGSQAAGWLRENFGIGKAPEGEGDGKGGEGEGDGKGEGDKGSGGGSIWGRK